MMKLLSLRLLSEVTTSSARPPSHHHHCFKQFYSLSRTPAITNPVSPPTKILSSHHHQWQTPKIYGFLSNTLLSKHFASTAHLKGPVKSIVGSRVGFIRTHFPKDKLSPWSSSSQRRSRSSWSRGLSGDTVVMGLIFANAAVFVLWHVLDRNLMYKNFTISVDNFKSGRVHTLITSAFSHIDMGHIVSNMIGLYFFGNNIARVFGPEYLLKLYLAGAVVGSIFYLVHHAYIAGAFKTQSIFSKDPSKIPGFGASGAVNAIMLLDIFLFPKATLYFDLFIPVPAILLGVFLIGKDVLRILEGDSQISGSAHLGGAAVAAAAWLRLGRRIRF